MVRSNQAYVGSQHAQYLSVNGHIVSAVYKGHNNISEGKYFQLVYWQGFEEITFYPSKNIQTWTVPAGTSKIHVECVGSKGAGIVSGNTIKPGYGGKITCDLIVNSNEKIYIMVGNVPTNASIASYNASDIRLRGTNLSNRIIVAGGGGSSVRHSGAVTLGSGGAGGGKISGDGTGYQPGHGGTQSTGGEGGKNNLPGNWAYNGKDGEFGYGGDVSNSASAGGAGGAGWYGGGAGCEFCATHYYLNLGGGGGGSSYPAEDNALCTNVVHEQGVNNGPGYVTIKATKPPERIDA